jgi:hypothetical protein
MKTSLLIASLFVLFISIVQSVDARSGCCSHHGGVCGCGCCDGSSLSAICAPYYPECNSNAGTATSNTQALQTTAPTAIQPTVTRVQFTPRPTATLTPTTTPTVTPKPMKTLTPKPTGSGKKTIPQSESFWTQFFTFFHWKK